VDPVIPSCVGACWTSCRSELPNLHERNTVRDWHNDECDCPEPDEELGVIADNLSKAGWSWGCVSAIDSNGRTIWIADAHRDDGKRFVVHAEEKLTAFVELESAIRVWANLFDKCKQTSAYLAALSGF
jgi:hypothetical protein